MFLKLGLRWQSVLKDLRVSSRTLCRNAPIHPTPQEKGVWRTKPRDIRPRREQRAKLETRGFPKSGSGGLLSEAVGFAFWMGLPWPPPPLRPCSLEITGSHYPPPTNGWVTWEFFSGEREELQRKSLWTLTFGNPRMKKRTEKSVVQKALLTLDPSKELFCISPSNMAHLRKVSGKQTEIETLQGTLWSIS